MFSLVLVATLVLPSVLGHCCFPDKMSAIVYTAGELETQTVLVDSTQQRFLTKPSTGDIVFRLDDFSEHKTYTQYADGKCTKFDADLTVFKKCIPDSATHLPPVTLAGVAVDAYQIVMSEDTSMTVVVTKDCLPVVHEQTLQGKVYTYFYTNVTTSPADLSELSQDLSNCE